MHADGDATLGCLRRAGFSLPTLSQAQCPSLHALTTLVVAREYDGLHAFAFGLDLLLDGLERLLASGSKRPTSR